MRIALVNWAKIWHGASRGGGINAYTQSLALALIERGHDVISIGSGTSPRLGGGRLSRKSQSDSTPALSGSGDLDCGPCEARRHADWRGIRVFEIVNSPVRAPSTYQFDRPELEESCPELERVFGELMELIEADLVHFQTLEGLSAGCIERARPAGVVFSLHNYHTICPQVYLMRDDTRVCTSFENGHACEGCHRPAWKAPGGRSRRSRAEIVGSVGDVVVPLPMLGVDTRGVIPGLDVDVRDDHRVPIGNEALAEPVSEREPNRYASRRSAMIRALNACDRVHAVSGFVARKFEALGVDRARIVTRTIGTSMVERADGHPAIRSASPQRAERAGMRRAIRVVFLGYHNRAKGLDLLIEALEHSEAAVLERMHLCVHALGVGSIEHRIERLEPRLARLSLSDGYERADIPWLLGGADLGVVPSVWWDNGPQTVLEMLACGVPVLGAELGGIPDFVEHGVNGLLFRGNDLEDLVAKLGEAILSGGLLDRLRGGIGATKSMGEHVEEMIGVYGGVCGQVHPESTGTGRMV